MIDKTTTDGGAWWGSGIQGVWTEVDGVVICDELKVIPFAELDSQLWDDKPPTPAKRVPFWRRWLAGKLICVAYWLDEDSYDRC